MSVPCVECGRESEHSCVCGPCELCGKRTLLARDGMCGEHSGLPDYIDSLEPGTIPVSYAELEGRRGEP